MNWAKDQEYAGWGRARTAKGDIARPEQMKCLTALAPAIGNRRSYGDAPLNNGGKAIDMTSFFTKIRFRYK